MNDKTSQFVAFKKQVKSYLYPEFQMTYSASVTH